MAEDRVLLTGLSGFLAKHIAAVLVRDGYVVRGTVRSQAQAQAATSALTAAGLDTSRLETVIADLGSDDGWDAALHGCRYVIHSASPFPRKQPRDPAGLIGAARGGTLRVLGAAARKGAERVVMTSSTAATYVGRGGLPDRPVNEADWSDPQGAGAFPYAIAKTLAERAAWEFCRDARLPLSVINPAFILGPMLDARANASLALIRAMLKGHLPAVPDIAFGVIDVRDVAEAHLAALTAQRALGRRFLLSGGTRSLMEMRDVLAEAMPEARHRLPRFVLPDPLVRAAGALLRQVRPLVPELGRRKTFDTGPARDVLAVDPRPANEAVAAAASSLREHGLV